MFILLYHLIKFNTPLSNRRMGVLNTYTNKIKKNRSNLEKIGEILKNRGKLIKLEEIRGNYSSHIRN